MRQNIDFTVPNQENVGIMFRQAQEAKEPYLLLISNPAGDPPYFCESVSQEKALPLMKKATERACMRVAMELDTRKDFNEQWKVQRKFAMN
jgi:hypothetical protein